MEEKRTSLFENGLIWFGAGVSIAEILTGTYLAPLGFGRGLAAVSHWTCDRLPDDVLCGIDRGEKQKKRDGNC